MRKHVVLFNALGFAGLIALAAAFISNRQQLETFARLFSHLRWYVFGLVAIIQVGSYVINALYYQSILYILGYTVELRRLFEGALATNFVNYVVPSAGLAGAGYLSQVLSPDVPRGKSVLAQFMRYGLTALAVLIMMPVGFLLIISGGGSGRTIVKITLLSAAAITVFSVALFIFIWQETAARRVIGWILIRIEGSRYKRFTPSIRYFVDEFYAGFRVMVQKKKHLLIPLAWSLVYIVIEISTFYAAFLAFGKMPNPGVAIMAYLFANISSLVGGFLFSTGVFELGMIGTLVALGQPFALSFSVTTIYRVLNLLIGLPPGFVYYRRYLSRLSK